MAKGIPFGSSLNDRGLQNALQGLAQASQNAQIDSTRAQGGGLPFGSSLGSANVQNALNGLAQAQTQDARPQDTGIPFGSGLGDARLQNALQGLAHVQTQDARPQESSLAPGSSLRSPQVQNALQSLAQNQQQNSAVCIVKNGLNGGELAPELMCRYDQPRYQMGCETMLNFIPLPAGGATRRPGLQHLNFSQWEYDSTVDVARLIPFVYSAEKQYMLCFAADKGSEQCGMTVFERDGNFLGYENVLPLVYTVHDISELSFCQCGKNLYIAHHSFPPAKLVWDGATSFTYEVINFKITTPMPSIASLVAGPDDSGSDDERIYKYYKATAVRDEDGEESLPSGVAAIHTKPLSTSHVVTITIGTVPGCSEYRIYKKKGGLFGFIGRCTQGETTFEDNGIDPDTLDQPPEQFEGFAQAGDYPSIVFMHQQRLGWASSDNDPLTIWMSQTSNFECMASKSPPADDDAIEATLASTQANRILWCMSDRTGLAIGTSGEEWYLTGADGASTVSPNSLSFQPQTAYGTEPGLSALRSNSSILFMQRGGRVVRDLGYSYVADRYEAKDLTLLAGHIFRGETQRCAAYAWQGSPSNILWCVLWDGALIGMTYLTDQEICAWHRHSTPNGKFLSCATMDDDMGRSRLWVMTLRTQTMEDGTKQRRLCVEMLGPVFDSGDRTQADNQAIYDKLGHDPSGKLMSIPALQYMWTTTRFVDGFLLEAYESVLIPCLPEAGQQGSQSTMRVKKLNGVTARVVDSCGCDVRVESYRGKPESPSGGKRGNDAAQARALPLGDKYVFYRDADWFCPLGAGYRERPRLIISAKENKPLTILGLAVTMELGTEAGETTYGQNTANAFA